MTLDGKQSLIAWASVLSMFGLFWLGMKYLGQVKIPDWLFHAAMIIIAFGLVRDALKFLRWLFAKSRTRRQRPL